MPSKQSCRLQFFSLSNQNIRLPQQASSIGFGYSLVFLLVHPRCRRVALSPCAADGVGSFSPCRYVLSCLHLLLYFEGVAQFFTPLPANGLTFLPVGCRVGHLLVTLGKGFFTLACRGCHQAWAADDFTISYFHCTCFFIGFRMHRCSRMCCGLLLCLQISAFIFQALFCCQIG